MSNYDRSNRVIPPAALATPASLASAADIGVFSVQGPITVARVGVLLATAQTGAAPVISFDLRPTFGSDTGRLAGKVGVCTFPAGGVGIGKTVTVEVRSKVNAGQQIVVAVTGAAGAGTGIPVVEWVTRTENSANQGSAQLGGATQPTPLALMGQPSMLDGADLGTPLELGGAAPIVIRKLEEGDTDQLDWEPRVHGEPGFTTVREVTVRAQERTPGPQPFPHQGLAESTPEQRERQKPWDEALKQEQEEKDKEAEERREEQERRRRENETPEERRAREERERKEQEARERHGQQGVAPPPPTYEPPRPA